MDQVSHIYYSLFTYLVNCIKTDKLIEKPNKGIRAQPSASPFAGVKLRPTGARLKLLGHKGINTRHTCEVLTGFSIGNACGGFIFLSLIYVSF